MAHWCARHRSNCRGRGRWPEMALRKVWASTSDPGEVCRMMRDGKDVCTFLLPPELPCWGILKRLAALTISFRPRWCSMISHLNDSWKLPISFRISQLAIHAMFDDTGMFNLTILTRTWPCQSTASTEQPSEAGSSMARVIATASFWQLSGCGNMYHCIRYWFTIFELYHTPPTFGYS